MRDGALNSEEDEEEEQKEPDPYELERDLLHERFQEKRRKINEIKQRRKTSRIKQRNMIDDLRAQREELLSVIKKMTEPIQNSSSQPKTSTTKT